MTQHIWPAALPENAVVDDIPPDAAVAPLAQAPGVETAPGALAPLEPTA